MDRTTFETGLTRDGFEIVSISMQPAAINPEHVHPFDARVLVDRRVDGPVEETRSVVRGEFVGDIDNSLGRRVLSHSHACSLRGSCHVTLAAAFRREASRTSYRYRFWFQRCPSRARMIISPLKNWT